MNQKKILSDLLQLKASENRVFVFDIDSTLYNVSPRNQEIVRHFSQIEENLNEELKTKLFSYKTSPKDWGIKAGLLRLGVQNFDQKIIKKIKSHWDQYFFGAHFLKHDLEYPGAVSYLKKLDQISPVYYLTGRDITRMGLGTEAQLKDSGFPLVKDRNKLILKPDKDFLDHDYKLEEIKKLKKTFNEIHFFENEPVIMNTIYDNLPDVKLYLIDSVHSGRAQAYDHILKIDPGFEF